MQPHFTLPQIITVQFLIPRLLNLNQIAPAAERFRSSAGNHSDAERGLGVKPVEELLELPVHGMCDGIHLFGTVVCDEQDVFVSEGDVHAVHVGWGEAFGVGWHHYACAGGVLFGHLLRGGDGSWGDGGCVK